EDQFQRHRGRGSAFVVVGLGEFLGAEMDRQEAGCGGRRLSSGDGEGLRAGPSGFGWQSGPELVEPLAEGVQGEAAEAAKLDVGQPGAAEIGQDGGPIDFAGREGHGAVSGDRSVTGPIMRTPREILKMHFTGRLRLLVGSDFRSDYGTSFFVRK